MRSYLEFLLVLSIAVISMTLTRGEGHDLEINSFSLDSPDEAPGITNLNDYIQNISLHMLPRGRHCVGVLQMEQRYCDAAFSSDLKFRIAEMQHKISECDTNSESCHATRQATLESLKDITILQDQEENEIKTKLSDIEIREAEIKNSTATKITKLVIELDTKLERLNENVESEKQVVNETFQDEIRTKELKFEETIREMTADYEAEINILGKEKEREIARLKRKHESEMKSVKEEYEDEISNLRKNYEKRILKLTKTFESDTEQLKISHKEEISKIERENQIEILKLKTSRNELEMELSKMKNLKSELSAHIQRIVEKYNSEFEVLNSTFVTTINILKKKQETELLSMNNESVSQLLFLNKKYNSETHMLNQTYITQITGMKEEHELNLANAKQKLSDEKIKFEIDTKRKLQQEFEQKIIDLKTELDRIKTGKKKEIDDLTSASVRIQQLHREEINILKRNNEEISNKLQKQVQILSAEVETGRKAVARYNDFCRGRATIQLTTLATGKYFISEFQLKWSEALNYCRRNGLELITIESENENQAIKDHIHYWASHRDNDYRRDYWIGLNDIHHEKTWTWSSSGAVQHYNSGLWHRGQPDDKDHDQDCAELTTKVNGDRVYPIKWNDHYCKEASYFICELDPKCI